LIYIAICMVLGTIQSISYFLLAASFILRKARWDRLTLPTSAAYHPYWKPYLIFDALSSTLILLASIIALVLFFRRSKLFPKLIVTIIPTVFILNLISYYLLGFIPRVAESAEYAKAGRNLIVSFIALHIWIPYFLVSKRVKETFVR